MGFLRLQTRNSRIPKSRIPKTKIPKSKIPYRNPPKGLGMTQQGILEFLRLKIPQILAGFQGRQPLRVQGVALIKFTSWARFIQLGSELKKNSRISTLNSKIPKPCVILGLDPRISSQKILKFRHCGNSVIARSE